MSTPSSAEANQAEARPPGRRARLAVLFTAVALGVAVGTAFVPTSRQPARAVERDARPVLPRSELLAGADASTTSLWTALLVFAVLGTAAVAILARRARMRPSNGTIHVVDTIALGGRRMLHLVRCGDRKYLLGNSERGIHYLASVPPEPHEQYAEEVAEPAIEEAADDPEHAEQPFASYLGGRNGRR